MIDIQVTCDVCGKKSEKFTPMDEGKSVNHVCEQEGFVVGVCRFWFSPTNDLCMDCYEDYAFPQKRGSGVVVFNGSQT